MWFPGSSVSWIHCWQDDANRRDASIYPHPAQVRFQNILAYLLELSSYSLFKIIPGHWQLAVITYFSVLLMPTTSRENPIVTPVSEALHFRRGMQNMRVKCSEWEIPIPGMRSNPSKPDYSVVQKAWWCVIKLFYDYFNKDRNNVPMRLPLHMRITGDSNVHIAPQYGNLHGTCSIQILTPNNVKKEEWQAFKQKVTDAWLNLKHCDGKPIHPFMNEKGEMCYCRPHWAKEWEDLQVDNQPIEKYLREKAFKDQIPQFRSGLEAACKAGGYTYQDAIKLFSTDFTRRYFAPEFDEMFVDSPSDTSE